jgi:protein O-mannosyl-transferase
VKSSQHTKPASEETAFVRFVKHPLVATALLTLATVLAYWPVVHARYINYDDTDYVTENARVQTGLTWKGIVWAFTSNHASNWHPLTWISHMLDVEWFGTGATGPHCVNLTLHVANTALLFLFLKRITNARWRSFLVAGLFALHPTHVESVAWVSERKDVLSALFFMLTLLAYEKYVSAVKIKSVDEPQSSSRLWYFVTLFVFALGLMSKPMLVTLPCLMLLMDWWPLNRFGSAEFKLQLMATTRLVWEKVPFFVLSGISCALTTWAQQKAIQPLEHLGFGDRVANAFVAYVQYLSKMFWPTKLALPYLHPGQWPAAQVWFSIALVGTGVVLAMRMARKRPYFFTGWFWYLGMMVPVIGFVQVGIQAMADRYTYLPFIGAFIALVWGLAEAFTHWKLSKKTGYLVSVTTLAVCGVLTHRQATLWHDSETLFKYSAVVTEGNFVALGNVGGMLFESGRLDEALDYYQQSHRTNPHYPEAVNSIGAILASRGDVAAIDWFRKTLDMQPNHADALFNMGNALAKSGNSAEAARFYHSALDARPDNFEARNNLGNNLIRMGKIDDAIYQYRLALDYNPDAAIIHKNLGEALAAAGKLNEAVLHYRTALLNTNDAGVNYSLGMTLAVQGHWAEAARHYEACVTLWPTHAEVRYNLGYAFQMQRQWDRAVQHLREAVRIKPDFAIAHFNLGCVLIEQGLLDEAKKHLGEALRFKPDYLEARKKLESVSDGAK